MDKCHLIPIKWVEMMQFYLLDITAKWDFEHLDRRLGTLIWSMLSGYRWVHDGVYIWHRSV